MWRMREAEWEREARARQKLIAQVLCSTLVCAVHRNYVALFPDPTQFSVSPTVPDIILYGYRVRTRRLGLHCACVEWYAICITSYLHYALRHIYVVRCTYLRCTCAIHI